VNYPYTLSALPGRLRLVCDGTHRNQILSSCAMDKSIGGGISSLDYWQPRCAHQRL